jgi:hypothetical protein
MTTPTDDTLAAERRLFRRTLIRVLLVQAAALFLLWVVHARYNVP